MLQPAPFAARPVLMGKGMEPGGNVTLGDGEREASPALGKLSSYQQAGEQRKATVGNLQG